MKRLAQITVLGVLLALAASAPATASFGLHDFDLRFVGPDGAGQMQAGSHPFALETSFEVNLAPKKGTPDGGTIKDLSIAQVPGLAGIPAAVPRCSTGDFLIKLNRSSSATKCADGSAVGLTTITIGIAGAGTDTSAGTDTIESPIYNLEPPPGVAAKLGFWVLEVPVTVDVGVSQEPPYDIVATLGNISQVVEFQGSEFTIWGVPAAHAHDAQRGRCYNTPEECPAGIAETPFLISPPACTGPLMTEWAVDPWAKPGSWVSGAVQTHDDASPPNPQGFSGCSKIGYSPSISSKPSSDSAETGSGLDFSVDFSDEGLKNPTGLAESDTEKSVVTLPEGVTINPSVAEGLAVCTPADFKRETISAAPGEGCPDASKLGTLQVKTPLVEETIEGSVFLAQQDDLATTTPGAENPFDSLIALYLVVRNTNLGVLVKLPLKVEPDPKTGQLVATLEDIPQLPLSHFNFHFREGKRAPLITPSACGTYTTKAVFTPWANPDTPHTVTSSFQITGGVGGGPCPPGGVPPFHPSFLAGAINNNAGSFSPFYMRLIRSDGEQDMTKFSAILPPGEIGSLVGVGKCPDSAIAIARSKTGRQEIASPSCPANSLIGHTLAGAGVGEALTYVGGQIYLGGPYKGDPLSVISVTPAVAGPFDAGTVVVRLALTLNPKTAEVEVDGANSDPIPHILKGIVLKVRDLRVYVDRPNFLLNPTSCDESSAKATLFGSYLNVFDPSDDRPVDLSTRYQAANCLNLGFKPKLGLNLKGGTKRGGHPGLIANYTPRAGDANVKGLVVRLPRSAFLDQAHIRTICTRVQFAAKACPAGAQYGYIRAWTPLLEEPLQGPVYLRSSNHKLPDLVFDLHGLVDVEVSTRIDSAQGGIRATLESAPDAPLSKVVLQMQGGKKGLIVNSRNLCGAVSKAKVEFEGHNGKRSTSNPVMRADCGGKRKHKRTHH